MRKRLLVPVLCLLATGCAHERKEDAPSAPRAEFEAMKDPPLTAQTHFAAARLAEAEKNFSTAIAQYKQTLKLEPKHLGAMYRLGILYAQMHQFPEALGTWNQYVTATNGSADAYGNLGFCHELAGHPEQAEAAYKKGIEADAKNGPCRVNYGLLLARRQRVAEALVQLQTVLSPAEAHYNIASVYESQGMKEQAKLEYRKALEIDQHFADAEQRLASLN
jgi:tetratricopeptide (TPR) repeat protein